MNHFQKTQYYGKEIVRITNKHNKTLGIELLKSNTLSLFFENYYKFCEENGCKKGCRELHKKHFDIKNSAYIGFDLSYATMSYWKKFYDSDVLKQWALDPDEEIVVSKKIILVYKEGMTYEECQAKAKIKRDGTNEFTDSVKKQIVRRQLFKCANKPNSTFEKKYSYNCLLFQVPYRNGSFGLEGYEIDHIIPIRDGGLATFENGQALCLNCHRVKSNTECQKIRKF